MADLAALFSSTFRSNEVDGVATSGAHKPVKSEIRALGSSIASEILSRYQAPVTGVQSRTLTTPPGSPAAGQRWIVPTGATGAWSGQAGKVAEWSGSAWAFTAPNAVFSAYVLDEAQLYGYDGTAWKILTGASLGFPTVAAMALVTTAAANIRAIVDKDIIGRTASRARSSNVATIVMQSAHGLTTGAVINVRGLGASDYNADQVTVTVVDSTTYTYANSGGNESTTADTAGQADRNGTYICDGAGGWTWNGDPLLDPAIAAQLGKAETIVADISSLATLTQYVTTTGALSTTDANWRSSPMLQAAPGEVYVFSGLGNTGVSSVTFYDASASALETHVSASNSAAYSGSFTAPASTAFVRFCYGTLGSIPSSFRGSISGAPLYLATRGQAVELIGHATGSGYLGTTGVLASSDTNWIYSGFLPVAPDDTIIFTLYGNTAVGSICFYDAGKQFISAKIGSSVAPLADVVDGSIRAPAGSAYLRIATASAAFQPTLAQTVKLLTTSAATWEALRALADRVDSGQAVELIDYATNIGYFGPTGVFTSDANWVCTSLLPAEAGDAISYKLWGHSLVGSICFFDATGAFLSSVVGGVVGSLQAYLFEGVAVAPVTTAYVRISTASAAFHPTPTQSARLPVTVGRVWGELNAAATVSFTLAPFEAPRQLQLKASDKILLYGDSISSADYQGYAAAMADLTGVSVYAGGFSGYTTAQLAANAQLQRIWDYDAELVIVMIGGNDTGAAGTVGTFGAISGETIVPETDIGADYAGSTLIQAISHIIRKFKARYDNIRVRANLTGSETEAERDAKIAPLLKPVLVFATSLPQKRVDSASAYSQSENWERKRRAVIECCNRYEVHCVDLMRETSLDMSVEPYWTAPTDTVNNRGVWYMDGLHPNKYLFRKMAEIVCGSLGIAGPSLTARYQGLWNASTNAPALSSGVGTSGDYYIVTTAGSTALDGVSGWQVGDWAIFNGAQWQQLRPTDTATALAFEAGSGIDILRVADEVTISVDPSDVAAFPNISFRNRLRNANFAINQRSVSGTVTLAAGAYGHDGLKAGAAGATYTFSSSGLDTTITISAGSLIMPVEAGMIEGGAYVLSHEGSAQARIWQGTGYSGSGSYTTATRIAPLAASGLAANTQTNAEFSSGTILRPQLEPGAHVTAFERRPPAIEFALCQRHLQMYLSDNGSVFGLTNYYGVAGNYLVVPVIFSQMFAAPTATILGTWTSTNIAGAGFGIDTNLVGHWYAAPAATGLMTYTNPSGGGFMLAAEI